MLGKEKTSSAPGKRKVGEVSGWALSKRGAAGAGWPHAGWGCSNPMFTWRHRSGMSPFLQESAVSSWVTGVCIRSC